MNQKYTSTSQHSGQHCQESGERLLFNSFLSNDHRGFRNGIAKLILIHFSLLYGTKNIRLFVNRNWLLASVSLFHFLSLFTYRLESKMPQSSAPLLWGRPWNACLAPRWTKTVTSEGDIFDPQGTLSGGESWLSKHWLWKGLFQNSPDRGIGNSAQRCLIDVHLIKGHF